MVIPPYNAAQENNLPAVLCREFRRAEDQKRYVRSGLNPSPSYHVSYPRKAHPVSHFTHLWQPLKGGRYFRLCDGCPFCEHSVRLDGPERCSATKTNCLPYRSRL